MHIQPLIKSSTKAHHLSTSINDNITYLITHLACLIQQVQFIISSYKQSIIIIKEITTSYVYTYTILTSSLSSIQLSSNRFTKCISISKWDMQLEHNSIIHNHQQNPPMYIYTNPHNHNIHQNPPMHKFTKSHIQLWQTHQLFKCMQCSRLF